MSNKKLSKDNLKIRNVSDGFSVERNNFAREISKVASKANKRIKRLEKNGLDDSPAYKRVQEALGSDKKFSVKGKTYRQLQTELMKINNFINAETSTIRGLNSALKKIAKATGVRYLKVSEIQAQAKTFFQIADKVEEYLRLVEGSATAIGYQAIWDSINKYIKDHKIAVGDTKQNMTAIIQGVIDMNKVIEKDFVYDQLF